MEFTEGTKTFFEKLKQAKNKAIVTDFLAGEEANDKAKAAAKIERKKDKTKEEEAKVRELREEVARLREQQAVAKSMSHKMGLGEKIIRGFFAYKLASLACRTLVGLTGAEAYRNGVAAGMARTATASIDDAIDKQAEQVTNDIEQGNMNEQRAQMIEDTLQSFERISQEAQEKGFTDENGEQLLTDADRENIQALADASRADDVEQYVAHCQSLGLDATQAREAYEQDRTFDDVRNLQAEKEKDHEQEQGYEMEV